MHNALQGEVPFPAFGDGVVLRFTNGDLARLRGKYGPKPGEAPRYDDKGNRIDHFWQIILNGISEIDPLIITDLLRVGLKKAGGKIHVDHVDFEDIVVPLGDCANELMDGIMLARWGKTAAQFAREAEEAEKAAAEENPPTGSVTDSTSSSASSGPDGAPASRRRNAGN